MLDLVSGQARIVETQKAKAFQNLSFTTGQAALEMLVALGVLVLSTSAAIMVAFGSQSTSVDTQTNSEALLIAQKELEEARSTANLGFNSLVSIPSTLEDIYTKYLDATDLTPCKKQVTSTVTWTTEPSRPERVELSTTLSDIQGVVALGGDCATDPPTARWDTPLSFNSVDFNPAGTPATGVDVQNKIVFMTGAPSSANDADFYVFDASNATVTDPPVLLGKLDTSPDGANDVDTALYADDYYYSFVANNNKTAPYKQLQVIKMPKDLSSGPSLIASAERTLPGVAGASPQGRSIYYYSSYVYMGTHRTAGKEFHIYDVADPSNPQWKGSIELNHNVNNIIVRDQLVGGTKKRIAYLATSGNTKDIFVLDVSNPASPAVLTSIDVGGNEDAEVIWVLGNYLYLGKDKGSGDDLFILDVSNPTSPSIKSSIDIQMKTGAAIRGLRVVGGLAFVGTTDSTQPFQVWDVSDLSNIKRRDVNVFNFSQKTVDLDYEADRIYTANESNDALRVLYSQ